MNIIKEINPIEINGEEYYTVAQFSDITRKSEQSIYILIRKGNSIRKLDAIYIDGKPLIKKSELTHFPFTGPGRKSIRDVYFYDEHGNVIQSVNEEHL